MVKRRRQVKRYQGSTKDTEADDFPGIPQLAGRHDQCNRAYHAENGAEPMGGAVQPFLNAVMGGFFGIFTGCHGCLVRSCHADTVLQRTGVRNK